VKFGLYKLYIIKLLFISIAV